MPEAVPSAGLVLLCDSFACSHQGTSGRSCPVHYGFVVRSVRKQLPPKDYPSPLGTAGYDCRAANKQGTRGDGQENLKQIPDFCSSGNNAVLVLLLRDDLSANSER